MKDILQLFSPPVFPDEERNRIAAILHTILIAGIFLSSLLIVLTLVVGSGYYTAVLVGIAIIVVASIVLELVMRRGYVREAGIALSLLLLVLETGMVYSTGTIRSPITVIYVICIVITILVVGEVAGTVMTFVILGLLYGLLLAENAGALPPVKLTEVGMTQWLTYAGAFIIINLLIVLASRNIQRALRKAKENEHTLTRRNAELQEVKASLEDKINERTRSAEEARMEAEAARRTLERQMWQVNGQAQLSQELQGQQDLPTLARSVIRHLCTYLELPTGAIFALEDDELRMLAGYAYTHRKRFDGRFEIGEGLVGQAALEKSPIVLTQVPDDYVALSTGMLDISPRQILAMPFAYAGQVAGVIELGALESLTEEQLTFMKGISETVAIAFTTAQARERINELLVETQAQAEELQRREEALRTANAELESQAESLRRSETRLREQQRELEATNVELEEKASALEESTHALQEQRTILDRQNRELKLAQEELKARAEALALASKYKSEFLANMSHELRTPLNSLLILARMLASNKEGNLSAEQIESATVIYNSGSDLLKLINDILDLSKVEAGKMTFHFEQVSLANLVQAMEVQFAPIAEEKGLHFNTVLGEDLPDTVKTDRQRVEQIVKNLLSNAFKFTRRGNVTLKITRGGPETVALHVIDTGIGISPEQQSVVFEAFQQADGGTNRKYGGTGLGLAISRQLAEHLGGKIALESGAGEGSTFTLYLSVDIESAEIPEGAGDVAEAAEAQPPVAPPPAKREPPPQIIRKPAPDKQVEFVAPGDRILLVIEDDPNFAEIVCNYARRQKFKCLIAEDGEKGVQWAESYRPAAIILDLKLPRMSGWEVLDALKGNPDTRHVPVHVISANAEDLNAYKMGAIGFLTKPISPEELESAFQRIETFIAREVKTLLLVEDDAGLRLSVRQLLNANNVHIDDAGTGEAALESLRRRSYDCMILDLNLPDMSGFEVLERMNTDEATSTCPIIVYTGRELTEEENLELLQYADSVIVKGVKSPERLLDETALFLHQIVAEMPAEKQRTIKELHGQEATLAGKHVLIVDDDMRNAFALSKLLGERGLKVSIAHHGLKALEMLEAAPKDFDILLMDIMMPELDGYETMQRIRAQMRFRNLPILALTAKAMKGDAEKCIAAGANDYLSKPVDVDRLFSMLRVWLYSR